MTFMNAFIHVSGANWCQSFFVSFLEVERLLSIFYYRRINFQYAILHFSSSPIRLNKEQNTNILMCFLWSFRNNFNNVRNWCVQSNMRYTQTFPIRFLQNPIIRVTPSTLFLDFYRTIGTFEFLFLLIYFKRNI